MRPVHLGGWIQSFHSAAGGLRLWFYVYRASDGRLQPGHLAIEGRTRCAGTRLRRAPHDCLSSQMVAPLLAAPLADYVFKPGMSAGGTLAAIFGPIIGIGSNHGIGLLIGLLGLLTALVAILALFNPLICNVEIDLPDHIPSETKVPIVVPEAND